MDGSNTSGSNESSKDFNEFKQSALNMAQLAKDMGIKIKDLHAVKVTIQLSEGDTLEIDPSKCQVSVMQGMEDYGYSFSISGKITKGKIEF